MPITRRCLLAALVVLLALCSGGALQANAQGTTVTLTILVPDWTRDILNQAVFDEFEVQHPGVQVVLAESPDVPGIPPAADDLDFHLEMVENDVSAADVVFVTSDQWTFSVEATRAGYLLDLAPLVASDPAFDAQDFFPAVWQSYQWDGGIWALPVSAGVLLITYDAAAFDRLGIPYPAGDWTLEDYAEASRALAEAGNGNFPGFITFNRLGLLFYSLTGAGFYDPSTPEAMPYFTAPALEAAVRLWAQLETENAAVQYTSGDFQRVPMRIDEPYTLSSFAQETGQTMAGALLPGGVAGLVVRGFAVSAGTSQPELAYELAKYMTLRPEMTMIYPFDETARQSMATRFTSFPPEVQTLLESAWANAVPVSALRYADYVVNAARSVQVDGIDALAALQEAEVQAMTALEMAAARRAETVVSVATPAPAPVLAAGEIVLRFGVRVPMPTLINQARWDQVMADFVAADPGVGQVDLQVRLDDQDFADADCFYDPENLVPQIDLSTLLNLDPFLNADPAFDPDDVIAGVLAQLERDSRIWAYPLTIQPAVLWYNTDLFAQAGLAFPDGAWTADAFNDAIQQLQRIVPEGRPVFVAPPLGNAYVLMLIAAYGGLPFDYRTDPPTVNLTDPTTVDAIRQVLDLARAGVIEYHELDVLGGGSGFSGPGEAPLYADRLDMVSFRLLFRNDPAFPGMTVQQLAPYPRGSAVIPVSYTVGTAYISANAQSPEACYRWIGTLAQHPDLFAAMPARRSLVDDPAVAAVQGADVMAFYQTYADLLEAPEVVIFPEVFGSATFTGHHVEHIWLNQAFDNYVLRNGDLEEGLNRAQANIVAYRECTAAIPPYDPTAGEGRDGYIGQLLACAVRVDPDLRARFGAG